MISTPNREKAVSLINEAVAAGARKQAACAEIGLAHARALDARRRPLRRSPSHHRAPDDGEQALRRGTRRGLSVANEPRLAGPPAQPDRATACR